MRMVNILRLAIAMSISAGLSAMCLVLYALILWPLWNWLMPGLFDLPTLTYIESLGLLVLISLMFRWNTLTYKASYQG